MSAQAAAVVFAPSRLAVEMGAASGIGLAAARAFAGHGRRVALVDRAGDALEAANRHLMVPEEDSFLNPKFLFS